MEYQHASSATTFSKKLANGGSLSGKHVYDGVFGGATKAGSKMEDYGEIFGGSANCSIPILDFPELKESKASVEARNSRPDYSKIFSGFGDSDFAVTYEELFAKPKKVKSSPQEAGAAAEARSCPAGQKHSNFSEEKQPPSPQVSFQLLDGVKQFSLSYDKSNPGSTNGTSGVTHIAQLHAVPGYTCLIDEITPLQMIEGNKPAHPVLNDAHLNDNVGEGIKQSKPLRKVVSGPQPRGAAKDTSRSHTDFQTKSSRNRSFSNDISFDAFDIGLGTQPSPMSRLSSLPNFGNNRDGFMSSMNSKFGVFCSDASEGATGSYSPPFFDEQIDANSPAAASAAAVTKAIEEAQAKLKIAKQLMERKKEGIQNRVRPSVNGLKPETREVKAVEKANRSKEEVQQMPQKVYNPKQVFTSLPEHNERKASKITPDFRNAKKSSPMKNAAGETHNRGSQCSRVDHGLEAESEKATEGFSEPGGTTEHKAMALEVKQANNVEIMKPSTNENECKEKMTGEENIKKPMEREKKEAFEEAPKQEKVETGLNSVKATFEFYMHRNNIKSAEELHHQEENKEKTRVAHEDEEGDQTHKAPYEQKESESMQKRLHEPEENAKFEIQGLEEIKTMKEPEEVHDWAKIEKKQRVVHIQEEMENQLNEVPVREENERKLDEIHRHEGNKKGQKEDLERVECEKKKNEGWGLEENEKKQNVVSKAENFEDSSQFHKQEANEVRFSDFHDKEGSEKRLGEDCMTKDDKNLEEAKQEEKIVNVDYQMNEIERGRVCKWIETERTQTDINLEAEDENYVKATQQAFTYLENNFEATNDVFKQDENEIVGKADEVHGDREKFEGVEVTAEVLAVEENGRTMEVTEDSFPKETEKGSKAIEEASNVVEEENFETGVPKQGLIGLDAIKKHMADLYSGETDLNHRKNEYHETEYGRICEQEKYIEEHTSELDENYEDVSEFEIGTSDEENESNCVYSHEERWLDNGIESKTQCDPEKHVEEAAACKLVENNKDGMESEVAINHEEDDTYFESSSDEKWVNNRNDEQVTQQPPVFDGEGKSIGISQEERTNKRTDEEENYQETITVEKREVEDTLQKEMKLEKKHHERKEEAKVRELEKEKERIAVERAIREARERAFAEARERAERAAAERATSGAHQRVMAEARESSFAEANSKSACEKVSIEAKLKAERAAVERATAEARERALERALSEKASFKAKNQTEKFAAEKFSGASRDAGIKSSDQQYKGPGPSSSSKYPSSSNHDERFSGANGESAERCKATLERNQRTAERAAKALAEKNMRDLLAQKEQAERNRLAETLDADVKRWSSGKERNLRALLSTLQYILGPDSGWQPIPLTDIISSAAVKKAYRKATLFVHPDKLQQRGASIQQKYTCEKVFDLLKDAWNKFSAEER